MTACATIIPTKVNAATLTAIPSGEITKRPGELIEYNFVFTPTLNRVATLRGFFREFDDSELSPLDPMNPFELLVSLGDSINNTTTIVRGTFTVDTPVEGGIRDAFIRILYEEEDSAGRKFTGLTLSATGADVVPVPEPLTMFGAAAALGYGAILKRRSSKNTES
jgi:hypothetical protein